MQFSSVLFHTIPSLAAFPIMQMSSKLGWGGAIFCTSVGMYAPRQFKFSGSSSGSKTMAYGFYSLVPRNNRNLTRLVENSNIFHRQWPSGPCRYQKIPYHN
ncbi:hypothetical protein NC653_009403 [Populus alba x Populus x berolinensis]|uniref:Uncharacterized protein n=1 Tax=Populus alba x Populus x berolinensis TaxID=444605 RepID=A0AAD6R951_9ROSI|nr:hypothetical protein NC653_009403 [Populus alba x Populus x berolinensis]